MTYFYDMSYWLMSLDKDRSKRLGPFVPFRDIKKQAAAKGEEVIDFMLNRLMGDLKRFGYSNIKNVRLN